MLRPFRDSLLLALILQLRWSKAAAARFWSTSHSLALLQASSFNLTFSDSGHWDFALLAGFQSLLRIYVIFTASPVSEFLIVERAGFRFAALWTLARAAHYSLVSGAVAGLPSVASAVAKGTELLLCLFSLALLGAFFA